MKGHKSGCKCVGCSPETRRRGMARLQARRNKSGGLKKAGLLVGKVFRKAPKALRRKIAKAIKARRFVSKHVKRHKKQGMKQKQAVAAALSEARRKKLLPPRENPPRVGRLVTYILTDKEEWEGKIGRVCGLPDGSMIILGRHKRAPLGRIRRIEYADEGKAIREGLKNPLLNWRHDFAASSDVRGKIVPSGIKIFGNKPTYSRR